MMSAFGWQLHLPEQFDASGLELVGSRRCLYGEGKVAHLMYRDQGRPVSIFMLPKRVRPEELVEVLAGQRPLGSGSLQVGGQAYSPTRRQIRESRVRLLPEAPLRNACVANMSVAENLGFRCFDERGFTALGWAVRRGPLRRKALTAIRDYKIKAPGPEAPIAGLSGGNVQRAVLARELDGDVAVLIAANPCFGLDFAAVAEIRSRIVAARNAGTAVLLISADLDEVFALADRIVVMSEGRLVYETPAETANVAEIGRHMAGDHA